MKAKRSAVSATLERMCWVLASICLLPLAATLILRVQYAGLATANTFAPPPSMQAGTTAAREIKLNTGEQQSLWSSHRRDEFARFSTAIGPPIIGVLSIPRLETTIPVFAGISEFAMTVGAGHISDTSALNATGNIAITAHRDGTFRILKDVQIGDSISLQVDDDDRQFIVKRTSIVTPRSVEVLEPTAVTTLTLITCYPFYFVGKAPQRYVLQAELAKPGKALPQPTTSPRAKVAQFNSI